MITAVYINRHDSHSIGSGPTAEALARQILEHWQDCGDGRGDVYLISDDAIPCEMLVQDTATIVSPDSTVARVQWHSIREGVTTYWTVTDHMKDGACSHTTVERAEDDDNDCSLCAECESYTPLNSPICRHCGADSRAL